ncbi:DUF429 domain-containing protein [Pseudovibrio sp. Tun.PSC04-5.I4]|uniref:DUF429 domain-containing protein n=1 Tax=Pseudovibrio sp. Tun.PSC04-5.I4 TaxID=1798213 RepID=UPI0008818A28|nr:DUF429 domain-containing protein [Pseudovibrio sp. Tun.PSC04-5.I4]SDR28738.1 Predicted nuclease (RNAse H fold) [Pseudovibrio sp. Tun.PSC04-5.I4]
MPDPAPSLHCVAGVDGCKAGWIAVFRWIGCDKAPEVRVFSSFAELITCEFAPRKIAVDMPIGLPDYIGQTGRGPEKAVRPLLGMRQSTVFSIPARAAIYCEDYREACAAALAHSAPPRKISKQAFYLFPKIRQIDALMTPELEDRVYEVHPEVAFWRLNGQDPIAIPKKVNGSSYGPGQDARRDLLVQFGYTASFLDQKPPKGAARDDLTDAAVNAVIAERLLTGQAEPFPTDYRRGERGLRMAIWA